MTTAVDPISFEVIRNALVAATDEMVLALKRSAYSTNIKTRSDFSCAFFDAELRSVAQGFAQPVHLGSMVEQVPQAIRRYGVDRLRPGDVIVTNDPHPSGVHLNDVSLISPVFVDGELLGYVANLAHHVDVGGGAPASIGAFREVFQEGVIIPPVRLVAGGAIVDDVFRLVLAQIRSKHETAGDFRAQIAANATGVQRVQALVERHGLATIRQVMVELLDYTERRTLSELAALPHGVYEAEGFVDNDGYTDEPVRLQVRIELGPDGVSFDTSGSDPQRRAPVNSTYAMTFSACAYALKCLVDPDLPVNDGFYRLVHLDAPLGSVTNCAWPAPVVGGWETQTRLVEVMFRALLPAFPDRLPAGTKGMMCQAGFGSLDDAAGSYTCFYDTFAGGYGGRSASDGPDAVQAHGQNTENAPVEETELNYPVRIDLLALVEDSEGPGRFRGGLGLRKDYRFDLATTFTVLADRDRNGPWGAAGGRSGRVAEYVHVRDGVETRLGSKSTIDLVPGDVISVRSCGGGGYGPPEERDPERVLRDVREGKVSARRALDEYRVVVSGDGLDLAATTELRRSIA
ncbi:MAG TPA: hydantoinase B/oxoprolinase family protein [Gaiella sp.]|nr:hydantoinase B/oxoprolinase family protein [Gaiella sp.]